MPTLAIIFLASIPFIVVIVLNVARRRHRARLTPQERRAEDEAMRDDPHSWWP